MTSGADACMADYDCCLCRIYHDGKAYDTVSVMATGDCPVWDETFALDFGQGRATADPPPDGSFIVGVYWVRSSATSMALGHAEVRPMEATQVTGEGANDWRELSGEMVGDSGGVCGTVQ